MVARVADAGTDPQADVEAFAQYNEGISAVHSHPRGSITAAEPQPRRAASAVSPAVSAAGGQGLSSRNFCRLRKAGSGWRPYPMQGSEKVQPIRSIFVLKY